MNKMKRIFSLVLAFSLVLGTFGAVVPAFAEEDAKVETPVVETKPETTETALKEVPKDVIGTEHEASVRRLVAFGIVGGYPDGTYKPENAVNRAHFSKIIVEALGLADAVPAAQGQNTGFKDVKGNHWAAGYINVASGNGLLKGFPDGTYRPAAQVTYAQALTMLVRALGYQDDFLQGTWPGNYVSKAADVGITAGVKIPSNAQEGAKRGYIADLVDNALDAKVVKVQTYKPGTSTVEYYETDIPLLKDKLEISKYEDTRIIEDKIVEDGLAKDEIRIKFLENTPGYKQERYDRGEIVKRPFAKNHEETFRFVADINPREIIGEEVTTYVNDDDKVVYITSENDDTAKFDFVDEDDKGEVSLVAFDRSYAIADDAKIHVFNANDKRFRALDNKVVIEDIVGKVGKFVVKNNKIVYAEILDQAETPSWMVVMENDKGVLKGINEDNNEFDIDLNKDATYEDALIYNTKGEKVALKDIEKGNLVYVQKQKYDGDDYAFATVVTDNKVTGEFGRVREDRISIDGKDIKVIKSSKKVTGQSTKDDIYQTYYSVDDIEDIEKWKDNGEDWENDMDDAFKQEVTVYKDATGRAAFFTTDVDSKSGYKFGIITRTYSDEDRIRIFTSIDGKEGKDQVFKAEKENDIANGKARLIELKSNDTLMTNKEADDNKVAENFLGSAVKFRLNKDGEIADGDFYVMDKDATWTIKDNDGDFGKDNMRVQPWIYGQATANGSETTFAVTSNIDVIDGVQVDPTKTYNLSDKAGNLDGQDAADANKKIDIKDFNLAKWDDIKDKDAKDLTFYIFPKNSRADEVDGLVFVGDQGAKTSDDEEAVYLIERWIKGDKYVGEVVFENGKKETLEIDGAKSLSKYDRRYPYIGKRKSGDKIELHIETKEDYDVYRHAKVDKVTGRTITLTYKDHSDVKQTKDFTLLSNAIVYEKDNKRSSSNVTKGSEISVAIENNRMIRTVSIHKQGEASPGGDEDELNDGEFFVETISGNEYMQLKGRDNIYQVLAKNADDFVKGDKVKVTFGKLDGKEVITNVEMVKPVTLGLEVINELKEVKKSIKKVDEVLAEVTLEITETGADAKTGAELTLDGTKVLEFDIAQGADASAIANAIGTAASSAVAEFTVSVTGTTVTVKQTVGNGKPVETGLAIADVETTTVIVENGVEEVAETLGEYTFDIKGESRFDGKINVKLGTEEKTISVSKGDKLSDLSFAFTNYTVIKSGDSVKLEETSGNATGIKPEFNIEFVVDFK